MVILINNNKIVRLYMAHKGIKISAFKRRLSKPKTSMHNHELNHIKIMSISIATKTPQSLIQLIVLTPWRPLECATSLLASNLDYRVYSNEELNPLE